MEMNKCTRKIRCEMGGCKKQAEFTIVPANGTLWSAFNFCGDCLVELYELIGAAIVPKSVKSVFLKEEEEGVLPKSKAAIFEKKDTTPQKKKS